MCVHFYCLKWRYLSDFHYWNIYSFITLFLFELLFSISTSMHFNRDLNFTKNCTFLILMDVLTNCFLECKVAASAVCISLQSMLSASNWACESILQLIMYCLISQLPPFLSSRWKWLKFHTILFVFLSWSSYSRLHVLLDVPQ